MARRKKSRLLRLGDLPIGTTCKTPDDPDNGLLGREIRLVSVSTGSVRVQFLDKTRSVIIDDEVKASGIPMYSNIAFNTEVELFTPAPKEQVEKRQRKPRAGVSFLTPAVD